jgi:hypothetical protein
MARRVEGHGRPADLSPLTVSDAFGRDLPETVAHDGARNVGGKVAPVPRTRVICVTMRD